MVTTQDEDFRKITSSEAESGWSTSGEEDAERLEAVLEGVYSCSSSLFRSSGLDPAERSSLLLLDKEIRESEEECKLKKAQEILKNIYTLLKIFIHF